MQIQVIRIYIYLMFSYFASPETQLNHPMHALENAHQEGDICMLINDCFVILYVSRLAYNTVHM